MENLENTGRRLALLSIGVSIGLAVIKIFAGIQANSTSLLSDGFESAADVVASVMVFIGLWLASRPPDSNHPYGHGRYDTLSGLGVGALLFLAGIGICVRGFLSMHDSQQLASYAVYVLLFSLVVKGILAFWKFRVGKRISSASLEADAWNDTADMISGLIALVAVGLSLWDPVNWRAADHIGGIIIGLVVVVLGIRVVLKTVDHLVDTMPDENLLAEIREVALSVPGAKGIEKCFARRTGLKYHVDLHLEVDPELTVRESHRIAKQVKVILKEELDWVADVLVHVEPSEGAFPASVGTTPHR